MNKLLNFNTEIQFINHNLNQHSPANYNNILRSAKSNNHKKPSSHSPSAISKDQTRFRKDLRTVSRTDHNPIKKQHDSCRHKTTKSNNNLHEDLKEQIIILREQNKLSKNENISLQEEIRRIEIQQQRLKKCVEKYKKQISFLEHELQRIKKECFKLLEIQSFKNTKLQQTLQQKQLMIHYLRSQISKDNPIQHSLLSRNIFLQVTTPIFRETQQKKPRGTHQSIASVQFLLNPIQEKSKLLLSSISQQNDRIRNPSSIDSLVFSKDKSKSFYNQLESSILLSSDQVSKITKEDFSQYLNEKKSNTYTEDSFGQKRQQPSQTNQQGKNIKIKTQTNNCKQFKKRLELTDKQNINYYSDIASSVETKKKGQERTGLKSKKKSRKFIEQFPNQSFENKMKRIQVALPSAKDGRNKNSSYR